METEIERFSELYPFIFKFEEKFNTETNVKWLQHNWSATLWYASLYVIVIFGGKYYMNDKPRFEIRPILATWSGCLAIFSIMGFIRLLPEFMDSIVTHGFAYSVCNSNFATNSPTSFWCYLYTISKVYELGDTVFIVLRKQRLIFLHWYHHITVMIYVWWSYQDIIATGRWFGIMNFFVHSFMYTYYALTALQFKIPRFAAMAITLMQLTQMVIGLTVSIYAYILLVNGEQCNQTYDSFKYSVGMYVSYLVLFANFFFNAYLTPKPSKPLVGPHGDKKVVTNGNAKLHVE